MTQTHLLALVVISLLVAIGYGVFRVFENTEFVADTLHKSMDEAAGQMAELTQPQEDDDSDYGTRPIGFHAAANRGN